MDALMKSVSRIHRCADAFRAAALPGKNLNSCQHIYIFHICHLPGISQEQLADKICVNKSSVTRQLTSLEKKGFILRRPDQNDRRILRAYPTKKAEETYPQVLDCMVRWNALLLEDFSEQERTALLSMLKRIAEKAVVLADGQRLQP